jgi:hypothetical protein
MPARSLRTRMLAAVGGLAVAASLGLVPANAAPVASSPGTAGKTAAAKPSITSQPKSITAYTTKAATFAVKASGATSYRWQTLKKSKWTPISKATATSYVVKVATGLNGARYRVVVTNKTGSVTSKTAKLTVKPWIGSGTRKDPYIVNHPFVSGAWTFSLGASNTNAWPVIKAAKLGGPAPAKGYTYVMTKLTLTKQGKKNIDPSELTAERIATNTANYYEFSCGKVPNDFFATFTKMKPGQTRSGNLCAAVKTSDLATALWTVFGATDAGAVTRFDLAVKLH